MRNDKIFWAKYSYEPGYTVVHGENGDQMNYEEISAYGIKLTDLFPNKDDNGNWPEIRGDMPADLPAEANPEEFPKRTILKPSGIT